MRTSHTIRAHAQKEINQTKIKGSCQSGRKVVAHNPKSDLPLVFLIEPFPIHKRMKKLFEI